MVASFTEFRPGFGGRLVFVPDDRADGAGQGTVRYMQMCICVYMSICVYVYVYMCVSIYLHLSLPMY